NNLVYCRNCFSTISQRSDSLSATHCEHSIHTSYQGSRQNKFAQFSLRSRYRHNQLAHTSNFGGNSVHQDRGWIGGLTSRNIHTDTPDCAQLLPQDMTELILKLP